MSPRPSPVWPALLLAAALVFQPQPATAQAPTPPEPVPGSGALEAIGPDGTPIGPCPLRHTDVQAQIAGFVARVTVTQMFENPFEDPVEAIYTFPLSQKGAVDAMRIRTGDREIRGEIRRREEARKLYEQAKQQGKLAALLDQERPNIFTQSLANLMPGARVEIEIQYVEPLAYEDGSFEFSFPMVVGPRFIPGQPTGHSGTGFSPDTSRVPDASRITPPVTPEGTRAGHDISLEVEIDAGVPILGIDSRLHEIETEQPDPTHARVKLRSRSEIPNRDFVLRYAVAGDQVKSGVLAHREAGKDGYLTLILLPPRRVTPESAAPKELIFVIDRSGSQRGLPLLKAKETMLWSLQHLNPNDTFQIVSFSNTTEMLFERPQPATPETIRQARRYVNDLEANGGTMMAEAVQRVCGTPADQNRLRIVSFMTDGYIGNDFEVIDLVKRLRGSSRWFPFGTGNSVNRFLLDQMARQGGGEVAYVLLNEDGQKVARRFYDRIASPVLTDVQLEFKNLDVIDVLPYEVSDVWAQSPLVIHARYRKPGRGTVVLRGFHRGEPYQQSLEVNLPSEASGNQAIASMWARARVDDLMARDLSALQRGSFPDDLREEIVSVALAHRIMTQFTSFIAVEERVINENGTQRRVIVPVEMPQGVDREGVFGGSEASSAYAPMLGQVLGHQVSGASSPMEAARSSRLLLRQKHTEAELDEARVDTTWSKPLPPRLRAKIGPRLQALIDGKISLSRYVSGAENTLNVRVTLDRGGDETMAALKRAGLRITVISDKAVVGAIPIAKLEVLLKLDFVREVTLP